MAVKTVVLEKIKKDVEAGYQYAKEHGMTGRSAVGTLNQQINQSIEFHVENPVDRIDYLDRLMEELDILDDNLQEKTNV